MFITESNPNIPDWLKTHILLKCPYCDYPMVDNENLTQRWCLNPECPGHMAQRVDKLAKRFGVKDFGPKSALSLVRSYEFKSHLDIIPLWFKEKPPAFIWEIGEMAMVPGFDKQWRDFARKAVSMEDVFMNIDTPIEILRAKDQLRKAESYFSIMQPLQGKVINIMMTGSVNGFSNRADFLKKVNNAYGDFIQLVDVGTRKTGVAYLVKEEFTTDHTKSEIAKSQGIPVLTPAELVAKIHTYSTYNMKGDDDKNEDG